MPGDKQKKKIYRRQKSEQQKRSDTLLLIPGTAGILNRTSLCWTGPLCWGSLAPPLVEHQGGFPSRSVVKNPPAIAGDMRDTDSIPGSGRSPGEGSGNSFQYFCWEIPWTEEPGELHSLWGCKKLDMPERLNTHTLCLNITETELGALRKQCCWGV